MYDRILFPTDGSDGANAVLEHVLDVVRGHDAELHVLYVADTNEHTVTRVDAEVVDGLSAVGGRVVDEVAARAEERGVSVVTDVVQGGVSETIADYADEYDVDLVAMSTHGRSGLKRVLVGSVTERVIRQSDVPVLTVRPDDEAQYPYRDVLVPTDGTETAEAALASGVDVATTHDSVLHLLTVLDVESFGFDVRSEEQIADLESGARAALDDARAVAEDAGVESVVDAVERGSSVYEEVRAYVEATDVDLVVVGSRRRSGVDRFLLGDVTENVVRTAPVPVMTVPRSSSDGSPGDRTQ